MTSGPGARIIHAPNGHEPAPAAESAVFHCQITAVLEITAAAGQGRREDRPVGPALGTTASAAFHGNGSSRGHERGLSARFGSHVWLYTARGQIARGVTRSIMGMA